MLNISVLSIMFSFLISDVSNLLNILVNLKHQHYGKNTRKTKNSS